MARTAALRIRFVQIPTGSDDSALYAVELHRGQTSTTVGRISTSRDYRTGRLTGAHALRVGGYHWTPFRNTRQAALIDLLDAYFEAAEREGAWDLGTYVAPAFVAAGLTLRQAVEAALATRPTPAPRRVAVVPAARRPSTTPATVAA